MTVEIRATIDQAMALQERLANEHVFLENILKQAPPTLWPALQQMIAERRKVADSVAERVKAVSVEIPPEAATYIPKETRG